MGAQLVVVFGEWSQGGWTDLLDAPREDAARRSQTLIGDEVRMVNQEAGGAWSEVEVVEQRNLGGWVRTRHLTAISPGLRDVWEKSERYRVVRAPGIDTAGDLFLPFGARLPGEPDGEQVRLTLPDERTVLVEPAEVRDGPLSLDAALARLRGFREIRYQKGGNTVEAMDAEGLIFLLYRVTGVKVPREPVDLRHFGTTVSFPEARAGDVVFFSTFNPDQPRPVVLLEDGTTFIEATPSGGVSFGRLEQLRRHREVLDVRRYGMTAPALGS
jgi:hypothetical protein